MKSFARPSFFRVFDLLVSTTNPGLKLTRWTHDGVTFERERHSFSGPRHGLTIEIITLTRAGRRPWTLMVTKEYWWAGPDSRAFKNLRWARPLSGQRAEILAWMRAQERALERTLEHSSGFARGDFAADETDSAEDSTDELERAVGVKDDA